MKINRQLQIDGENIAEFYYKEDDYYLYKRVGFAPVTSEYQLTAEELNNIYKSGKICRVRRIKDK